ncbi:MAG: hypothetical protein N2109_13590, partial [Fimbriimonadales bacterium]|nr:hypothetical protein [Fimbriimonadales bacterium]
IRKGDRRYYEEWLRRQSQRADDAELLRRMNDPSLTSIERLRLAVIRESELANIARELDILNRRLKATAKAEATDQSTPMVGSRPVDTGNLNREKKVRLHETRQMVDGWTSVARAMAFLREATDALRENRIQPTPENVETLIRDENFIKRLEKQGLNLEEFKRRLRSGAVLSAVARAVRDQARFTEEIKAGRRMPGTVTALPENPESEEYRALDTYLREAGVEGGIQQATEIME